MRYFAIILLSIFSNICLALPDNLNASGQEYCYSLGEVCIDNSTKIIDGYPVDRDCWEYDEQFQCFSYPQNTDCTADELALPQDSIVEWVTDPALENGTIPKKWSEKKDTDSLCLIDDRFGCSDWYETSDGFEAKTCLTAEKNTCNPEDCTLVGQKCTQFVNGICVAEEIEFDCSNGSVCNSETGVDIASDQGQAFEEMIGASSLLDLISTSGEVDPDTGQLSLFKGDSESCEGMTSDGRNMIVAVGVAGTIASYVFGGFFGVLSAPLSAYAIAVGSGKMQCCQNNPDDVYVEESFGYCDEGDRDLAAARATQRAVKAGGNVATTCACTDFSGLFPIIAPANGEFTDCRTICSNPYTRADTIGAKQIKVNKKEQWCHFDNQLAKVLQVEGRKQIDEIINSPVGNKESRTLTIDYHGLNTGDWTGETIVAGNDIRFWQWGEECNNAETRFNAQASNDLHCPSGVNQIVAVCSNPEEGCGNLPSNPYPIQSDWDIYKLSGNSENERQVANKFTQFEGECFENDTCSWNISGWPAGIGSQMTRKSDLVWMPSTPYGDNSGDNLQWMYDFSTNTLNIEAVTATHTGSPSANPMLRIKQVGTENWEIIPLPLDTQGTHEITLTNGIQLGFSGECNSMLCNYRMDQTVTLTPKPWYTYTPKQTRSYCYLRISTPFGSTCLDSTSKSWGDSYEPHCEGFTLDEFTTLDLSRMDLSEYLDTLGEKARESIMKEIENDEAE